MKNNQKIYTIIAHKFGDNQMHSYLVASVFKKKKAQDIAESHRDYRGGKYACVVYESDPFVFSNKQDDYSKEIYRAKSIKD